MRKKLISKIKSITLIVVIFFFICQSNAVNKINVSNLKHIVIDSVSIPIPPQEHPRLYLRSEEAKEIGSRLNDPVLKPIVDAIILKSGESLQLKVEWNAIQYLALRDSVLGRETIDSTLYLLKRTQLSDEGDAARRTGRIMVTGAIVYDWLFPLLTSSEKDQFINEFIRLAKTLECGYPPTGQGSVTGHSSESFIMRDMLSAGIAIYDEYPEMYELAAIRFFTDHLPVRNWFYNGHAYHQGDSYGPLRYSWDTYPLMIFEKMGVKESIYNPEQQYVPYYYIYTTRPDGQRLRSGDTYLHSNHGAPGAPWSQYVGTLFTASYYNDGVLLDQFLRQGGSNGSEHGRINQNEYIFQFLWWNTNIKRESVEKLPLSKYFGAPFGWMVARTGWDKESVIAEMKINEYNFNNHQHLDAGTFQLYYKGSLATESGYYNSYGTPHTKNYYWRTIAHNTLLIYDPSEQFSSSGDFVNDGGQRLPNRRYEPRNLEVMINPDNGYKTGDISATSIGPDENTPDYSYLKGDITKAYSSKVNNVKRSFVFLNLHNNEVPAALVVFDKVVSSNSDFNKFWLLHSIDEPLVSNNKTTIIRKDNNDSGKLVNITLLPDSNNLKINSIGGPDKDFWVFGKNYHPGFSGDEKASWRIEVSPVIAEEENYFLNIMQVMDKCNTELTVKKIIEDKVAGVQISDRIVLFSKDSEQLDTSFEFSIKDEGNFKILLTDLSPGLWTIYKNKNILVYSCEVETNKGVIYTNGEKGEYTVTIGVRSNDKK